MNRSKILNGGIGGGGGGEEIEMEESYENAISYNILVVSAEEERIKSPRGLKVAE